MLPNPHLNFNAPITDFLPPEDQLRCDLLHDYEEGSLAVNNPAGGLKQAVWEGYLDGHTFKVWIPPNGTVTSVLTVTGEVTELSLAFDSNMRPHFAYVEDGIVKLFWYNTSTGQNEIYVGDAAFSPRLCLDDKRERQSTNRDILFFYLREGALYCRQQRDRYLVEYFLIDTLAVRIGQVGMSKGNRVQIELISTDVCGEVGNFLIFDAVTDADISVVYESNEVLSDFCIMPKSVITITDGEYRVNSGTWTSSSGLGNPGDTFQVRRTSADQFETKVTCTLNVGWYSGVFSITTLDMCGEEGNFIIFTPVINAYKSSVYTSNTVTATRCILPSAEISIVDGEYSINGGTWTSETGTVQIDDEIKVRRQSSDQFETEVTCTLTIGWYSGIFSITTGAQGPCIEQYVRPNFNAANADFSAQIGYARPDFDAADAQFPPLCE